MKTLFEWNEKYSVKVASLDEQHQNFFKLTNQILTLLEKNHNENLREELILILVEFGKYAFFHLDFEENCMHKCKFSDIPDHCVAHDFYRDRVKNFLRKARDPQTDIFELAKEVAEFSQFWLAHHILKKDHEYIATFAKNHIS